MSRDLNKWMGIGRLGKDPESKTLQSGNMVCNFSVACGDDYKDKNTGEKVEKTEWINVVAWGRLAEICAEYLTKGKQVFLEGKFTTRKWEDKDGNTRYSSEILLNNMQMLGGPSEGGGRQEAPQQQQRAAPKQAEEPFEDEIPF